jgi:hypothetical protein
MPVMWTPWSTDLKGQQPALGKTAECSENSGFSFSLEFVDLWFVDVNWAAR